MANESPTSVLFDRDGYDVAIANGDTIITDQPGFLSVGKDGSIARFIKVDSSGQLVMVGSGIAGTPSGGIISIQGVSGGTAITVSGSVAVTQSTASNLLANVGGLGTSGAAIVGNPVRIAGSDGVNTRDILTDSNGRAIVIPTSIVSTANSSTASLGSNAAFTGTFEEVKDYAIVAVFVRADQASATDGLEIQWSTNGSTTDDTDTYTIGPNNGRFFTFGPEARYFRIKYTNGSVAQTSFKLQIIYHYFNMKPSSHRINDAINDENDAELVKAVITAKTTGGSFINLTANNAGNLKVTNDSVYVEDVAHTTGDNGTFILGVRNDAATALTSTNGDYSPLATDAAGRIGIADLGGSITVDGTITANIGTTNGLALDTTLAKLTITQGTALGSNTQALVGGSVTTAAPTYTTGNINPLSLTTAGALRVDGSGVTQPISGTVTANAGTGTFNIAGTVTANAGTGNFNNASIGTIASAVPGSASYVGFSDGTNLQGARVFDVDTGAGTQYVQGVNLRLSANGGSVEFGTNSNPIRIDPTGTTTQPISGTVTANAGTGNFTVVQATASNLLANVGGLGASGIAVSGNPVRIGGSDGTNTRDILTDTSGRQIIIGAAANGAGATGNPVLIAGSDGSNVRSIRTATDGTVRVDPTGTTTQPISGTVTANIGTTNGIALDATLAKLTIAQSTALGSNTQALVGGSVTTAAPTYTTGNINPLSLTTSGSLRVDGSGVTQPVSGTVTANIGTTNGLALDATLAKLTIAQSTALGSNTQALMGGSVTTAAPTYTTGNINPLSLTTAGALRIDGSGVTQPVSGTVTANQGTANSLANRWPVIITDGTNTRPTGDVAARASFEKITDGTNTAAVKAASTAAVAADSALVVAISPNNTISSKEIKSSTGTTTSVASSVTNVTLLSANTNRLGATIYNDSSLSNLFIKLGTTASATSFSVILTPTGYYEVPFGYTGQIDGIWSVASGNARITELT